MGSRLVLTLLEQPGAARSNQEQSGAVRNSQEHPGVARSSQEESGAARDLRQGISAKRPQPRDLSKVISAHLSLILFGISRWSN